MCKGQISHIEEYQIIHTSILHSRKNLTPASLEHGLDLVDRLQRVRKGKNSDFTVETPGQRDPNQVMRGDIARDVTLITWHVMRKQLWLCSLLLQAPQSIHEENMNYLNRYYLNRYQPVWNNEEENHTWRESKQVFFQETTDLWGIS